MAGLLDPTEDIISPDERKAITQQNLFSTLLQGGMQLLAGGENLYPWQRAQMIGQAAQSFGGMPAQNQQMLGNAAQMKLRGIQGQEAQKKLQDQREWDKTLADPQKVQAFIGSLPQQYQGMALAQLKAQGPAAVTQILQHSNDTEMKNLQIEALRRKAQQDAAWQNYMQGGGQAAPQPIGAPGQQAPVPLQGQAAAPPAANITPAQQVLASPSSAPAQPYQPQTLNDLVSSLTPAQRAALQTMPAEEGRKELLKMASPKTKPVFDTVTKQPVFVPENMPPNARFVPLEGSGMDQSVHADKVLIDQAAKEHGELQSNALSAQKGLGQVNRLGSLLDQMNTGRFTTTTQDILAMGKGLGIDLKSFGIDDKTGIAQAADALTKQFALQMRDPSSGAGMPGAMSNQDREFLAKMVPTLETTPEGRKLIIEYARKMYGRQIELAKIANDYVRGGGLKKDPAGLYAELQKYANANPMFTENDVPPNGMTPIPQQGGGQNDIFDRYGLKRR